MVVFPGVLHSQRCAWCKLVILSNSLVSSLPQRVLLTLESIKVLICLDLFFSMTGFQMHYFPSSPDAFLGDVSSSLAQSFPTLLQVYTNVTFTFASFSLVLHTTDHMLWPICKKMIYPDEMKSSLYALHKYTTQWLHPTFERKASYEVLSNYVKNSSTFYSKPHPTTRNMGRENVYLIEVKCLHSRQ